MVIKNLKKISRLHKVDIGGQLFLKNRLKFRFIKKWIFIFDEDILKVEKNYPSILEKFKKKQEFFKFLALRKKNKKFNFKFNILNYDIDSEFKKYYFNLKVNNVIKFGIRYDQFNRRLMFAKRLFKQKQRLKVFWNLKEFQFKNIIFKLNKNKFKYIYFFYFLEYRLDMVLYRSFFFPSLLAVQKYIKTYGIFVNNKYIKKFNYITNIGDKIEISKSIDSLFYILFLLKSQILVPPSKYLEVNYTNLNIIVKSFFLHKVKKQKQNLVPTNKGITRFYPNKTKKRVNKNYLKKERSMTNSNLNFLIFKKKKF